MEEMRTEEREATIYVYTMTSDTGFAPKPFGGLCTLACCKPQIRRAAAQLVSERFWQQLREKENVSRWSACQKKRLAQEKKINFDLTGLAFVRGNVGAVCKMDFCDFVRGQNLWVVGLAGKGLPCLPEAGRGSVIFAMQVSNILSFPEYWQRGCKRPQPAADYFVRPQPEADYWQQNNSIRNCADNVYEVDSAAHRIVVHPSFHLTGGNLDPGAVVHDLSGEFVLLSDHFCYFGREAKKLSLPFEVKRGHRVLSKDSALSGWLNNNVAAGGHVCGRPCQCGVRFPEEVNLT